MANLDGAVVLVTGAARGLGRSFAETFSEAGASIVACDLLEEVHELQSLGAHTEVADVRSVDDMSQLADAVAAKHGKVDVVIANAGVATLTLPQGTLAEQAAAFDEVMDTNTRGVFLTARAALPLMTGGGHIVIVSTDHVAPIPDGPRKQPASLDVYDASKWALEGFVWGWAGSLASRNIKVNALAMGETDTPMLRNHMATNGATQEAIDAAASSWMDPAAIAAVARDLVIEDDPERTGTTIGFWPGHPIELPAL